MNDARDARWKAVAVVALLYLGAALWTYAVVLPKPAALLPINPYLPAIDQLTRWDQSIAVASVARNARAVFAEPLQFFDGFQCYPMPRSYTLGEHMFGVGLLAAVPYLLTHDPVLSFNVVLVLSVWIAGLSMFFLSREFVGSAPAAFVAGLLFALEPARTGGVAHPFAYADLWTPAALLFLHRLFARGGVANALALALFAGLEIAQSLYPLLWTAVLLLCFALHLLVVHRRHVLALLPYVLLCSMLLAGVAWLVLGPYLDTRATWGLLSNRGSLPLDANHYPHVSLLVVLGLLGLADRLRGPRRVLGSDPRLTFFVAAVLLLWLAAGPVRLEFAGFAVPSLRQLLRTFIPGLDAVRGLSSMVEGSNLALAFLAGYGVLVLVERVPRRVALVLVAGIALWIVQQQSVPLAAWLATPPIEDVALLDRSTGPTLDLPHPPPGSLKGMANADILRLASYSPRRSSACYASFGSPLDAEVGALAAQLPDADAADALAALGFRTVVLHLQNYWRPDLRRFESQLAASPESQARLHPIGRTDQLAVFALTGRTPVSASFEALAGDPGGLAASTALEVSGERAPLELALVNHTRNTFRQPDPIAPTDLVVRWTDAVGNAVGDESVRALLPLALAAGGTRTLSVDVALPRAPGSYVVTLAPARTPQLVLARRTVRVTQEPVSSRP